LRGARLCRALAHPGYDHERSASADQIVRVVLDLAAEVAGEEPRLDFEQGVFTNKVPAMTGFERGYRALG
jgi:hypothetical protein